MTDLAGRTALVTGGGSGLGAAIASALRAAGADVVVVGRDEAKLDAVVARHVCAKQQRSTGASILLYLV